MDRRGFEDAAKALLGGARLRVDVGLGPFTTFRVGGRADWFAELCTVDELQSILSLAAAATVPVTLLGGGSNVVVADRGVRGLVIRLLLVGITQPAADTVRAEAGVSINGRVRGTLGRGLACLEEWAGTPGTVGGAIYGNAHWNRRNIGDLVTRVCLVSREGKMSRCAATEMGFSY